MAILRSTNIDLETKLANRIRKVTERLQNLDKARMGDSPRYYILLEKYLEEYKRVRLAQKNEQSARYNPATEFDKSIMRLEDRK